MEEDWDTAPFTVVRRAASSGGVGRVNHKGVAFRYVKRRLVGTGHATPHARETTSAPGGSAPGDASPTAAKRAKREPLAVTHSGSAPVPVRRRQAPIRLGSDCTGLNTTHLALEALGLKSSVTDVFVSDVDQKVRLVLDQNFRAQTTFTNILTRDESVLGESHLDLYTSGPPCQPFSPDGLGLGMQDARGYVFLKVLLTINAAKPRTFILENVKGLKARHKRVFDFIIHYLQQIKDTTGDRLYRVRTRQLDTLTHGGLPQARPRIYIVGWKRTEEKQPFTWPEEISVVPIDQLLDDTRGPGPPSTKNVTQILTRALAKIKSWGGDPNKDTFIINVDSSPLHGGGHYMEGCSPCLTRTRCGSGGHWISSRGRRMLRVELERLQGVPPGRLQLPPGVTERQYQQMLGNAFTVSVIGRVILRLLQTVGLLSPNVQDVWSSPASPPPPLSPPPRPSHRRGTTSLPATVPGGM